MSALFSARHSANFDFFGAEALFSARSSAALFREINFSSSQGGISESHRGMQKNVEDNHLTLPVLRLHAREARKRPTARTAKNSA